MIHGPLLLWVSPPAPPFLIKPLKVKLGSFFDPIAILLMNGMEKVICLFEE